MDTKAEQGAPSARFTPGPWELTKVERVGPCLTALLVTETLGIATIACYQDDATAYRNARLMVASPDLYEACKAALTTRGMGGPGKVYEALRAAVAKAEGAAK